MEKAKKNEVIFENNSIPLFFIRIDKGQVFDGKNYYNEGDFVCFTPFLMKKNINKDYKAVSKIKYEVYKSFSEVEPENKEKLIKEISKNYISLAFYGSLKKFPMPDEIFESKKGFENKKEEIEYDLDDEDEIKSFIDSFDFIMGGDVTDSDIPNDFEEFSNVLKKNIQEFNIMRFVELSKLGLDKFDSDKWSILLDDLISRVITLEDRALILYIVFLSAMKFDDVKMINKYLRKNWEILRFYGKNNWIDFVMGFMNNKMFLSEIEKL